MVSKIGVVAAMGAVLMGCGGGSMGKLNADIESDIAFVSEAESVYFQHDRGISRVDLTTHEREFIVDSRYHVDSVTEDGALWVFGDSDTNLYIYTPASMDTPFPINELSGRASAVAVSPDATQVAVSRHADFDTPQSTWGETEDDTIYLIDVATRAVTIIPASRPGWVLDLRWREADQLEMMHRDPDTQRDSGLLLDLNTGTRTPFTWVGGPSSDARQGLDSCGGQTLVTDDNGVHTESGGQRTTRVELVGRSRGFHDYQSTFQTAFFTPSCEVIFFIFDDTLYAHHMASGRTGEVDAARGAWTLPAD